MEPSKTHLPSTSALFLEEGFVGPSPPLLQQTCFGTRGDSCLFLLFTEWKLGEGKKKRGSGNWF